jgi:glyoxylase-like metal-dependent hydrolase (beta-lactamase superfamily II)
MKTLHLLENIYMIDNNYNAIFLVKGSKQSAIIETAYPSEFQTMKRGFKKVKMGIKDFQYLIGTHIHLDHFGAAGHFVRENPDLKIIIHPKGSKHLIDPSNLNKSAKRALGERYSLVGQMLDVEPNQILNIQDGKEIDLGDQKLKMIYTPGHAKHHMIIYNIDKDTIFTGDSLANTIKGYPKIVVTPPPDYNFESAINSINKIRSLNPRYLIQTHGGLLALEDNPNIFDEVIDQHKIWIDFVKELMAENGPSNAEEFHLIFKKKNPLNLSNNEFKEMAKKYRHVPYMNYQGVLRYLNLKNK